jgi:hypothetical protein
LQPSSPVLTEEFRDKEVVYAKDQPEYAQLPALCNAAGVVMSRWKLTEQERAAVALGADIMLSLHTYNQPLQPVLMEVITNEADLVGICTRMGVL